MSLCLVIAALFFCPIHAEKKDTATTKEKKQIEIPWEKIKISDSAKKKLKEINLDFDQVMKEIKEASSIFKLNITKEELKKEEGFQTESIKDEKNIIMFNTSGGITAEYVFIKKKLHKVGGLMRHDKKVKYVLTLSFQSKDCIEWLKFYFPEKDYEVTLNFTHKKEIKIHKISYRPNYNNKEKSKRYNIDFKENGDIGNISHVKYN